MRRVLLTVVAFFAALVITWVAAMAVYVLVTTMGWVFDRDGGVAMGTAFGIGPALGILAGIIAALLVAMRGRGTPPPPR